MAERSGGGYIARDVSGRKADLEAGGIGAHLAERRSCLPVRPVTEFKDNPFSGGREGWGRMVGIW